MGKIAVSSFGSEQAKLFSLENQQGVKVEITNLGARIVKFWVPVEGKQRNIAYGFASDEDYLTKDAYPGAIVGPVAGRIAKGKTIIKGKEVVLTPNENGNTLHGGPESFETFYWQETLKEDENAITFALENADGYNGFPGPIHIQVTYQLTEDNELNISYHAESDKDTLFNPTNHVYFNLDGSTMQPIDHQVMKLKAEAFAELDEENMPTGKLVPVEGTAFDFREGREFKQGFVSEALQNKMVDGFDHPWVVAKETPQAEVWNADKTLKLEVSTDCSAIVIYTMNHGDADKGTVDHGAFTMEAQELPDACNIDGFGNIILSKGDVFESQTSYKVIF